MIMAYLFSFSSIVAQGIMLVAKGILLGLALGIPIGAVGVMTIQRTSDHGFWHGLSTGMASSFADFSYGLIAALGLSIVMEPLMKWQIPIRIGGCLLILVYGIVILRRKVTAEEVTISADDESSSCLKSFLSAIPVAFSNPVTILTFTVGFATIGIGQMALTDALFLSVGVFIGGSIWWVLLAGVVSKLRERMDLSIRSKLTRGSGYTLIVLALAIAGSVVNAGI